MAETIHSFFHRRAIAVLPGITLSDSCIVGAGSVPAHSIVAGNPAKVIATDAHLLSYGRIDPARPPMRVSDAGPLPGVEDGSAIAGAA